MPGFNHYPLQKAIFQKLNTDATLLSMGVGVYDRVPQGQAFPYITLGEATVSDWSTKTTSGTEQRFTLRIWSREGGRKQAELIMERIHTLLHDGSLSIAGQTVVMVRFLSSDLLQENDGWTYQGIMRFRVLIET